MAAIVSPVPAVRTASRVARIMRSIRSAQMANPRNAGLYTGSVTVTDNGATQPATTTLSYPLTDTNFGVFHVTGGALVSSASNSVVAAYSAGSSRTTTMARVEAMTNARYVAVQVRPSTSPYRFLVDGRFVSLTGTTLATTTGTTRQFILLDFGTRAIRRLSVDLTTNSGVYGFFVEATAKCWPVDLSDAVHAVMFGDSYVAGSGPTIGADGVANQLGDWLGFYMHAAGVGGVGWTTNTYPTASANNFPQRLALNELSLSPYPPDVIFTMASYNDRNSTDAVMTAAVLAGLQTMRSQFPGVPIIEFGMAPANTGPSATVQGRELSAANAVLATGDPLIAFVPVSRDATGSWVTGTGFVGTTTGTGNSDWATTTDGVHPSDEGAAMYGRRYASGAIGALKAMYAGYAYA